MTKLEEQFSPNGSGTLPGEHDYRYDPLSVNDDVHYPMKTHKKTIVNRMFYIDVTNVHPNDVANFMEAAKKCLVQLPGESPEIDKLRANGLWEDYWIPSRTQSDVGVFARFRNWLVGKKPLTRIEIVKVDVYDGKNN